MARNNIKFTELSNVLKYPPSCRAGLSTLHSDIIDYVSKHFSPTRKCKAISTSAINMASYYLVQGQQLPTEWIISDLFATLPDEPDDLESVLKSYNIYLTDRDIAWDLQEVEESLDSSKPVEPKKPKKSNVIVPKEKSLLSSPMETLKEDLTLKPPKVPMFDPNEIVVSYTKNGTRYVMYESLPKIPTKQCEISATTKLESMKETDLLQLFPRSVVQTRFSCCYKRYDTLDYDEKLGCILKINGFSKQDVVDNIIRYPHFYGLQKYMPDGEQKGFFSTIEIDGELHDTLTVWDSLEDSKYIPRVGDLIKEYVIRRYLLERDILHIEHKYKLVGELRPFISLIMPASMYYDYGYDSPVDLAQHCVRSRVAYRITRNPILNGLVE